ncbi:hypothetical protein HK101_003397 [Irineochytrium annulatum]|nr:hypothetical protein HK101_003397 [Irineochytrium annulatum]
MSGQQQDDGMFSFMSTQGYTLPFFGCLGDIPTSILTYFCGCYVVGATAGKLFKPSGDFDVTSCLCAPIAAYRIRKKTQQLYGIREAEDATMCASVVQDVHELTARGAIPPLLGGAAENKTGNGQPQMRTH